MFSIIIVRFDDVDGFEMVLDSVCLCWLMLLIFVIFSIAGSGVAFSVSLVWIGCLVCESFPSWGLLPSMYALTLTCIV